MMGGFPLGFTGPLLPLPSPCSLRGKGNLPVQEVTGWRQRSPSREARLETRGTRPGGCARGSWPRRGRGLRTFQPAAVCSSSRLQHAESPSNRAGSSSLSFWERSPDGLEMHRKEHVASLRRQEPGGCREHHSRFSTHAHARRNNNRAPSSLC